MNENLKFNAFLNSWMPSLNEHPELSIQVNRDELVRMLLASWNAAIVSLDTAQPEGCELVACHDGEGWSLTVEYDGDTIAILKWPDYWPKTQTGEELQAKGFVIV